MKTKLIVLSIGMLLISVSFVSVVNATVVLSESNSSKLGIIKDKLIEKLGLEKYQKIEGDVSDKIDIHFMTILPVDYDLPFYLFLRDIAVILVAIMMMLFGHNFVGEGLGAVLCVLLLGVPAFLLALAITTLDFIEVLPMISLPVLIEQFGVIGALLIFIFIVPFLLVVLCAIFVLVTPIMWVDLMTDLIQYAISNA